MHGHADAVTVRLLGGLGNQLFQFAAARAIAVRLGCPMFVDVGFLAATLKVETPRAFALGWLIDSSLVVDSRPPTQVGLLADRVRLRLGLTRRVFREHGFTYDERVRSIQPGTTLIGSFQSWRYFDAIATDLRRQVLAAAPRSDWSERTGTELETLSDWTAVHIRRGDYLQSHNAAFHGVLGPDYYRAALNAMDPNRATRIVVFSDDPAAAAAVLGERGEDAIVVTPPGESHPMESIALMARAKRIVTANSSFSWWGAWLAGGTATVATPTPWFRSNAYDERDLRPLTWLSVDSVPPAS